MDFPFDFRLQADPATLSGTQYFELLPGRYMGTCWNEQSRFIDEYTFCLIEGIFREHVPGYDHWSFMEVSRLAWDGIVLDLASLRAELTRLDKSAPAILPCGKALRLRESFAESWQANERALAELLGDLEQWLDQTLKTHEVISVLGI